MILWLFWASEQYGRETQLFRKIIDIEFTWTLIRMCLWRRLVELFEVLFISCCSHNRDERDRHSAALQGKQDGCCLQVWAMACIKIQDVTANRNKKCKRLFRGVSGEETQCGEEKALRVSSGLTIPSLSRGIWWTGSLSQSMSAPSVPCGAYIMTLVHSYSRVSYFPPKSTVRAPVFGRYQFFGTSEHRGKAHGSLLSGWMNYNYTACCWFPTSCKYFNTSITVLTNQVWKLLIALFKVPNTGAFTVTQYGFSNFLVCL